jgi:hypothetical protein
MEKPIKETVVIVHGTWAKFNPEILQWYQRPIHTDSSEGFVGKLNAALEQRGSAAQCWSHCTEGREIFHWTGDNSWIARTAAAYELAAYVAKLQSQGWCCHIVAHSHGGNVVVEALPLLLDSQHAKAPLGRIVTLGTPFIDASAPISERVRRGYRALKFVARIAFIVSLLVSIIWSSIRIANGWINFTYPLDLVVLFILAAGIIVLPAKWFGHWIVRRKKRSIEPTVDEALKRQPQLLAIGSSEDEAWQFLHHMREFANPLATSENPLSYLAKSVRDRISRSNQLFYIRHASNWEDLGKHKLSAFIAMSICFAWACVWLAFTAKAAWHGYKETGWSLPPVLFNLICGMFIWYVLVLIFMEFFGTSFHLLSMTPFRWCRQLLGAVPSIFTGIGTYLFRNRGWPKLVAIAMGLSDYPHQLPSIERIPKIAAFENFVKYEDIPLIALENARKRRKTSIGRYVEKTSKAFSELVVTATDVNALLQTIETDQLLIHAAYYTDHECIVRIADWISGATPSDAALRAHEEVGEYNRTI